MICYTHNLLKSAVEFLNNPTFFWFKFQTMETYILNLLISVMTFLATTISYFLTVIFMVKFYNIHNKKKSSCRFQQHFQENSIMKDYCSEIIVAKKINRNDPHICLESDQSSIFFY